MPNTLSSRSNASIGNKSNNNIVVQNSTISNMVVCNNASDTVKMLGELKQFDALQQYITDILSTACTLHPLYPVFSAKLNNKLNKLISTPETEDAFKQYPKRIKGTYQINHENYPYMSKEETPWEYAYRTQMPVELEMTSYQEYLGDEIDPFPVTKYADGMITIIKAPSFPSPVNAKLSSGEITVSFKLQRKPCMEFGKMVFGTVSEECGFSFDLISYKGIEKTDFKISKTENYDLHILLQREKLFNEMRKTKRLTLKIEDDVFLDSTLNEKDLSSETFEKSPYIIKHLESLLVIEKHTACKFDLSISDVYPNDHTTALLLASSLDEKWLPIHMRFDNEIRCDYDNIPDNLTDDIYTNSDFVIEGKMISVFLHGQHFSVDKYMIIYRNARINNIKSVIKNQKKKKKGILLTFKPTSGNETFIKFSKLEGIKVI